jgi:hypothetical protein
MKLFRNWLAAAVVAGFGGTASAQYPVRGAAYYPTPQPAVRSVYPATVQPGVKVFPNTGGIPVPVPVVPRVDFDYVVIYKPSIFTPWRAYGTYETQHQAQHAARRLEFAGVAVRIERVRDRGLFGW